MLRVAFVLCLVAAVSRQQSSSIDNRYPHVIYECSFDDGNICDFVRTNEDVPMSVGTWKAKPSISPGFGTYLYSRVNTTEKTSGYSEIELDISRLADYENYRIGRFRYSISQTRAGSTLNRLTYIELRSYEQDGRPAHSHGLRLGRSNYGKWSVVYFLITPRYASIRLKFSVGGPFDGVLAFDHFQIRTEAPLPEPTTTTTEPTTTTTEAPTTTTEAAPTEKECRMSFDGKVQQFGADASVNRTNLDNGKSHLTSTPYIPENPCRFLVVANVRKDKVQFVNLNFGFNPEYGRKHAVTIQVYVNGKIQYRKPGTSGATKITPDPMYGYTWSDGKTAVNITGNKDTGYTITSESGCPYKFETKNANSMDDFFVADVTPDGITDSGRDDKCGNF